MLPPLLLAACLAVISAGVDAKDLEVSGSLGNVAFCGWKLGGTTVLLLLLQCDLMPHGTIGVQKMYHRRYISVLHESL